MPLHLFQELMCLLLLRPFFQLSLLSHPYLPLYQQFQVIDDQPPVPNDISSVNNETFDNMSITNECEDEGEIGDVNNFDSLDINFHETKETNMLSPPGKKPKITDTDDTSPKQKGWNYIREEDIVLCRAFINLSKNSIEDTEKNWKYFGEMSISYLVSQYWRIPSPEIFFIKFSHKSW